MAVRLHGKNMKHGDERRQSLKYVGRELVNDAHVRKEEIDMAKVLIGIVVIFFICYALRIYLNIVWVISQFHKENKGSAIAIPADRHLIAQSVSNILVVTNSSVNMIVYCFINKQFRSHCREQIVKSVPIRGFNNVLPSMTRTNTNFEMQNI